ncbi:hypothetical protein AAFF_G00216900 [Aldrovandia affinis]|uniref:Uncharacterized protein n=1 Tax=Aldrovandia affinis TaxID=143900 RepID=A0AAD7RGR8_9TELE|nr:hypothetical protein AAFF_G00216900 [Aldrovandia affinis]
MRIAHHRASVQATGGGISATNLTPEDDRIGAIIGESAVVGVFAEGDTDHFTAAASEDEELIQRRTLPHRRNLPGPHQHPLQAIPVRGGSYLRLSYGHKGILFSQLVK